MKLASIVPPRLRRFVGNHWDRLRDAKRLWEDPNLLRCCSHEREKLKLYFATRFDLSRLAFDTGTIAFEKELQLLQELIELSNALPGPILEIGTLFGETTTRMALWKEPRKKIITVDNYSWNPWGIGSSTHQSLTKRVLRYLTETGHVEVHCCDKDAFFRDYKGERPSLVFLDADHTYEATKADIEWAQRIGARIISGHDYSDDAPGVGRAVQEAGGAARHAGGLWALNGPYISAAVASEAA